jgi:hypothetical protein
MARESDAVTIPVTALYVLEGFERRDAVLDALEEMPGRVRSSLAGASPATLGALTGAGWSPFQVLCHVRDIGIVYSARFRWIVFDEEPLLPNYNEDAWVAASTDTVADVEAVLAEIEGARAGMMRFLRRAPGEAWARTGRHEVIGEVTLEPYVRHQLAHELGHLEQLVQALEVPS